MSKREKYIEEESDMEKNQVKKVMLVFQGKSIILKLMLGQICISATEIGRKPHGFL